MNHKDPLSKEELDAFNEKMKKFKEEGVGLFTRKELSIFSGGGAYEYTKKGDLFEVKDIGRK